ncbi:MAG: GNAT family N-acetyltransferase [Nitrososphaerota archaeon]|nr:GNAT family N-acetyltransferase [Nitrososphaerota archaeon]
MPLQIRHAKKEELAAVADLVVRTKRLNAEFDPLFAVVADAKSRAEKYVQATFEGSGRLLIVAVEGTKVLGFMRAEIRERTFYEPHTEGFISDFYILPEHRRKALGNEMLEQASSELKKMGAEIIVADVPSQNEIANRFYAKRGFRALTSLFGKAP